MRSNSGFGYTKFQTSIYDRDLALFPSDEELKEMCAKLNPNDMIKDTKTLKGFTVVPHFYGKMIHFSLRIDYFLDILLVKSDYMDINLYRILTDIKTSAYHQQMSSYSSEAIFNALHRHDHLNVFFQSFRYYFNLFIILEEYSKKHLKKHVSRKSLRQRD
jgi:hypothetical protein